MVGVVGVSESTRVQEWNGWGMEELEKEGYWYKHEEYKSCTLCWKWIVASLQKPLLGQIRTKGGRVAIETVITINIPSKWPSLSSLPLYLLGNYSLQLSARLKTVAGLFFLFSLCGTRKAKPFFYYYYSLESSTLKSKFAAALNWPYSCKQQKSLHFICSSCMNIWYEIKCVFVPAKMKEQVDGCAPTRCVSVAEQQRKRKKGVKREGLNE